MHAAFENVRHVVYVESILALLVLALLQQICVLKHMNIRVTELCQAANKTFGKVVLRGERLHISSLVVCLASKRISLCLTVCNRLQVHSYAKRETTLDRSIAVATSHYMRMCWRGEGEEK
jgi:hypothetical protein